MSPKNKGTFGRGKPPITDPDDFITGVQTTAERLKPYVPHIVLGSGAILLLSIGVAIFAWLGDRRAAAATAAFSDVVEVTSQRAGMPTFTNGQLEDPAYETAEAQAEVALERLETLRANHGSSRLSKRARLIEARLLRDLGRYDQARESYRAVAESDAPEVLRVLAREGLAYSHEDEALAEDDATAREQGLERALEMFELMQPRDSGPMRAHALYHQGRILAALGRTDDAIERFEQGRAAPGGVGVRADIDDRLSLLAAPPAAGETEAPPATGEGEGDSDAPDSDEELDVVPSEASDGSQESTEP